MTPSRVVDTSSKDVTAGIFTASEAVVVASDSPVADQIFGLFRRHNNVQGKHKLNLCINNG